MLLHSKETQEGYKKCFESTTLQELQHKKSGLSSKVAGVLATTPDEEQYPVACRGKLGGKSSSNGTESMNNVFQIPRFLHEAAALMKLVEMEARRYKKKQKEAMLCESVMPPQKMLAFAIQCELATQVPQRTLAL